ncbi:hypothetical protein CR513_20390, partial [Mucuna pruriens]
MEHPTNMCPTLQEDKLENIECTKVLGGGYQYGRQSYSNWQFNNQQLQRQPYQPNSNQDIGTKIWTSHGHASSESRQYQAPAFRQQPQQQIPPQQNSSLMEDLMKQISECGTTGQHCESDVISAGSGSIPSQQSRIRKGISLPFPNRTVSTRRFEINEDLLKLFRKVEINIPILNGIKHIPKYAKFLKELYIHKRKKIKGAVETGVVVLVLVKHEDANAGFQ